MTGPREKMSGASEGAGPPPPQVRELEEAYDTTLENFMAALDLRDVETFGHSKTVARYSHVLAESCGVCDPATLENIRRGASCTTRARWPSPTPS